MKTPHWLELPDDSESVDAALREMNASATHFQQQDTSDSGSRADRYETAWAKLQGMQPWLSDGSQADAFALFLHSTHDAIWKSSGNRHRGFEDFDRAILHMNELAEGKLGPRNTANAGTQIWRGNTLEVLLEDPKSKSTSFYLNPEAHELSIRLLGRGFFDRAESGLLEILDNPGHWLKFEPEFRFLEHGTALLDYQKAHWSEDDAESLWQLPANMGEFYPHLTQAQLVKLNTHQKEHEEVNSFTWQSSFHFESRDVLRLAYKLGVTDLRQAVDVESLRAQLLPAFMEQFRLSRIGPERELAFAVMSGADLPDATRFVTNAVDYHLLRLFQQYALTVLPSDQKTDTRVHPAILATLSQPWVFPTRTTLESYSNCSATKTPTNQWEIKKGKKTHLVLTDAEAYWTGQTLNALFTTQPLRTGESFYKEDTYAHEFYRGDTRLADEVEAWHLTLQDLHPDISRINIPLGPTIIERARQQITRGNSAPGANPPASAGMLFAVQLTDESLKSNGQFLDRFLHRSFSDFSDYHLSPKRVTTLQKLVNKTRGHHPASFHRAIDENGRSAWAYTINGNEFHLGGNFHTSMEALAITYAGGTPGNIINQTIFSKLLNEQPMMTIEQLKDEISKAKTSAKPLRWGTPFQPADVNPERLMEAALIYLEADGPDRPIHQSHLPE